MLVLFGQSSGAVPPFDPGILASKGSLFLTRPSLGHYTLTQKRAPLPGADIFNWISSKKLKIRIDRTYALGEAAAAHRYLESRKSTGKLLLIP